ncbi:MAG: ABC transporter permease [Chloroflexota bacterium]|nr:ABC transporter permease [Chloroflexota bacterium]
MSAIDRERDRADGTTRPVAAPSVPPATSPSFVTVPTRPDRPELSRRAPRGRPTALALARRSPIGAVAALVLLLVLAVALFGPLLGTGDPVATNPLAVFAPPSSTLPLGGDYLGRSELARLVAGLRVSFALAAASALLAAAVGIALGVTAGYSGGAADEAVMRLTDLLFAFPTLLLALLIAMVLGPGIPGVLATIVVATIPVFARVARGPTLSVRTTEYAIAARVAGATPSRIIFRHVLPNITSPLLVQLAFTLSGALIAESGLSFLGLGVQPPMPSLGSLLRDGKTYMELAPWMMIVPGVALAATILAINLLGDELQTLIDPRLRRR